MCVGVPRAGRLRSAGFRATRTSIGTASTYRPRAFAQLEKVDSKAWLREVMGHEELFLALHDHLPAEMIYERELLICRL